MNGVRYVLDNLSGAWDVMLGRAEGLNRLDVSLEGFWRSFAAVLLVAPFAVLAFFSQQQIAYESRLALDNPDEFEGGSLGAAMTAFAVDWFAFPILFAFLAPVLGLGSRYVPFIVTRNWASVIIAAGVAVIHALHVVGLLPSSVAPFVVVIAIAVALRFSYVIARVALAVSMTLALAIVALDFLVSVTIWAVFDRLT